MSKNERKHPQGYWTGIGISTDIGATLEQRHKVELGPLTEQEKARQKRSLVIGLA